MNRFLLLAAIAIFSFLGVAAEDRYKEVAKLIEPSTNVLTFTSATTYKRFVQKSGRTYDIIVFFTASKNVGCAMCEDWEAAFIEVALTAKEQLPDEKIVFSIVKYDTVGEVFRLYNLNSAPVVTYVPHDLQDTSKMMPKLTMSLANLEAAFPDPIAQFVAQRSGKKLEIIYSPWPKIVALGGFVLFCLVAGRQVALIFIPLLRRYKWIWFLFSIVLYGLGVSGSIYSYLRNVPNHGYDQKSKSPVYFAGDRQQFFYEGVIIWAILVFGAVALVLSAYARPPYFVRPGRPLINAAFLVCFGVLFRIYVTLYLGKASWYKYGMSNPLTWPWI
jgi:hypothetical protein